MSIIKAVYDHLEQDPTLRGLLAMSSIDPTKKAIFDEWADWQTNFPYMVLSFSFSEGNHWAKNETILNIDIFTESDTVTAEEIKQACIFALDRQTIIDQTDGAQVRFYYNRDGFIVEPTPNISHWNLEFSLHHWRKSFIDHLAPPIKYANPPTPIDLAVENMGAGQYKLTWALDGQAPANLDHYVIFLDDIYQGSVQDRESREFILNDVATDMAHYVYMASIMSDGTEHYSTAVNF